MTNEEYLRMKNMLGTVVERQVKTDEQLSRLTEQTARNTEGIAGLLALREMHEQEITALQRETSAKFDEVAERFKDTDERLNALINIVERYITKGE
jgi:peptidoglycan hydrolase CwlO-like protein